MLIEWLPVAKWLSLWGFVYVVLGIFLPYLMAKGVLRYEPAGRTVSVREFYTGGELGPVSFMLSLHVALDVYKDKAYSHIILIMFCAAILVLGFLATFVWANAFCRNLLGKPVNVNRVWTDTRNFAVCVCLAGLFIQGFLTLARIRLEAALKP